MKLFYRPWFLASLVGVNALGTVWGVFWYWEQLKQTPWYFLPVVPDSPLHAALFGVYVYWLLRGAVPRLAGWQRCLAWAGVLGSIKYGLWTTVILSQYFISQGTVPTLQDWMLYASHGGMAVQALVYSDKLPRSIRAAALALAWFVLNDFCDYVFYTHPRLPLDNQVAVAGWTAALLTALAAALTLYLFNRWTKGTAGK
jgi:uncharacterized membrane protein YpjA